MKFLLQEMKLSVLVLFVYCVVPAASSTVDDVKRLLARANSSNYDKRIRPVKNQTSAFELEMDLSLYSIIDFDQLKETLFTSVEIIVNWKDELIAWEKEDYGGIEGFHFPQDALWKPDVYLNNSYKSTRFGSENLHLWVTYDGNVSWALLEALETQCSVNTKYFPLDTQTCSLFVEVAGYYGSELFLRSMGDVLLIHYRPNSVWEINSTSAVEHTYSEYEYTYPSVEFQLVLKRRPSYFIINIFLPIGFLTCLGPFTFMIPLSEGARSNFAMTLFLAFSFSLTNVASHLPQNSDEIPHLSNYIVAMSFFGCLNVFICLLQTNRREGWGAVDKTLVGIYLFITMLVTVISYSCALGQTW